MKKSGDEVLSSLKYTGVLTEEKVAPQKRGLKDQ